ncbi:hypothetical protein [Bdellovibrio bacteriovorus]|uniref:Uncharacterized protein n=1 Tax=Bdellovibrio bacteriovorus str. Tiberius TaxID=1069642 RepID=K7YRI1_BDEBC|nr:hypothetical protein [Bdellovibrio bacteriovorus]AFY02446.1 Hypothetical protein Bdt_2765 [Bdellovibrio bacteriovorus str. Tiberius]
MKKLASVLFMVICSSVVQAAPHTLFCQRPYHHDIFNTNLRITVTQEPTMKVLWIDTHIPYGIRPMPYPIQTLECRDNGVSIVAGDSDIKRHIELHVEDDRGKLVYLDGQGPKDPAISYTCFPDTIRTFCTGN